MDVIEVGSSQAVRGRVVEVKVLGALPLVDQNETDWKVPCIVHPSKGCTTVTHSSNAEARLLCSKLMTHGLLK